MHIALVAELRKSPVAVRGESKILYQYFQYINTYDKNAAYHRQRFQATIWHHVIERMPMPEPPFTAPEDVLSPKGSVSNLRVMFNSGPGGWSLAALDWDGVPSLGVRWNGDSGNPIGNPQSRGIPTWFILPREVADTLSNQFVDPMGALGDHNADITRVRLRPLPQRVWHGKKQEESDDVWVLSITDRTRGSMQIMNPRTGHFLVLDRPHVRSLMRDPANDTPGGIKHGILDLNVQAVLQDGKLRLEPLRSLTERIMELSAELWTAGSGSKDGDIRRLLLDCRHALTSPQGELGPWEQECLDMAEASIGDGWLRLALASMKKAIEVNRLPPAEYHYGFNYSKRSGA